MRDHDAIENVGLRERSGSINSEDRLVSFLYELMRDHLPVGTVEDVLRNSMMKETQFTNGYLAKYAEDIAARMRENWKRPPNGRPIYPASRSHK
jgi:hypothetical protein